MKNLNVEGVDSCVAKFSNAHMTLEIDYGWYGGHAKRGDSNINFKERFTRVGGKKARLATYIDDTTYAGNNPGEKYVADLYVVVRRPQSKRIPMTTSLVMTVRGESEKEQELAKRIFRSVRFQ